MEVPKKVAVVLFYTPQRDALLQDRRKISKWGEEYGFFGGTVEEGETPREAADRELFEELGLRNVELEFFREYDHVNPERRITVRRTVYLAPMPSLEGLTCNEGIPEIRKFEDSFNLKMIPGFNELFREIYDYLEINGRFS